MVDGEQALTRRWSSGSPVFQIYRRSPLELELRVVQDRLPVSYSPLRGKKNRWGGVSDS